jgi:hexokinase
VKDVCFLASDRAAKLVAITLSMILERMNKPNSVTIAVDGSLYKLHPRLATLINKYIQEYSPGRKFTLLLAEDGSGKGAGLTAAIALKLKNKL